MASKFDIFSGANISLEVGTATTDGTVATDFVMVPEVAEFVTSRIRIYCN
ncbi:TPA: hypothetical protein ACHQP4_000526 [Klebsiella aerogenes]|nr:hypothetical protein [Klebsiella aerogenes]WPS10223.1 hypothetical protein SM907_09690 [Klebsiella aerogenes]VAG21037.1 Uncharacterised protein [Klebsiella aerogenes]